MERFEVSRLSPGESLLVKTETGSVYHLKAETVPEPVNEAGSIFRGLRATRESNHNLDGRPEAIGNDPALLFLSPGDPEGFLRAGDTLEIDWDRDHPENREWDMQFGPVFHKLYTSRIVDIEFVPVDNN